MSKGKGVKNGERGKGRWNAKNIFKLLQDGMIKHASSNFL
jgi:hypothetical protein